MILIRAGSLSIEAELSTVSEIALKPTQQPEKRDSAKPEQAEIEIFLQRRRD